MTSVLVDDTWLLDDKKVVVSTKEIGGKFHNVCKCMKLKVTGFELKKKINFINT